MYVRTENGIYEVVGADSCSYLNAPPEMYYITSYNKNILKSKVIAQADTIEELCDEIVVKENLLSKPVLLGKVIDFDENGEKHYTGEYGYKGIAYTLKELMKKYKGISIRGAIWTDEGLIYVAKINENGWRSRCKFEICLDYDIVKEIR